MGETIEADENAGENKKVPGEVDEVVATYWEEMGDLRRVWTGEMTISEFYRKRDARNRTYMEKKGGYKRSET